MSNEEIQIEIDGLPVEVDRAEYEANPEAVIEEVRQARVEHRLSEDVFDEADDYDTLVTQWGVSE